MEGVLLCGVFEGCGGEVGCGGCLECVCVVCVSCVCEWVG